MEKIQNFPLIKLSLAYPRIAAWVVLAVGMVLLLVIEARDVGLQPGNWIALIVATVAVAGLCIWIVSWEDVDETNPTKPEDTSPVSGDVAPAETPDTGEATPDDK